MYCPNCGKEIDDNSKYCGNCGYKIPHRREVHISVDPKLKEELKQAFLDPMHAEIASVPFSILVIILAFFANLFLSYRILPAMMHFAGNLAGNGIFGGITSDWFHASAGTHFMNAAGSTITVYLVVIAVLLLLDVLNKEELQFQKLFSQAGSVLFIPVVLVFAGVLLSSALWLSSCILMLALALVLMKLEQKMPEKLNGWWKALILVIAAAVILLIFSHAVSVVVKEAAGTSLRYFLQGWGGY